MKRVAVMMAALLFLIPMRGNAADPATFSVKQEHEQGKPASCSFIIFYVHSPDMISLNMNETRGRLFIAITLTTADRLIGKRLHLMLDDWDVLEMPIKGKPKSLSYGVLAKRVAEGRTLMKAVAIAAQTTKQVKLIAPGVEVILPIDGLREAAEEYTRCQTTRLT